MLLLMVSNRAYAERKAAIASRGPKYQLCKACNPVVIDLAADEDDEEESKLVGGTMKKYDCEDETEQGKLMDVDEKKGFGDGKEGEMVICSKNDESGTFAALDVPSTYSGEMSNIITETHLNNAATTNDNNLQESAGTSSEDQSDYLGVQQTLMDRKHVEDIR